MPKKSLGGSQYFVTFVDDCTQKVWAYSLRSKDEALTVFSRCLAEVANQTWHWVKTLRSDNGGEYTSRHHKLHSEFRGWDQWWRDAPGWRRNWTLRGQPNLTLAKWAKWGAESKWPTEWWSGEQQWLSRAFPVPKAEEKAYAQGEAKDVDAWIWHRGRCTGLKWIRNVLERRWTSEDEVRVG